MYQSNAGQQYKENAIQTMSPEELTLSLYNGLVKFFMKAELGLEEKDNQMINESLIRAQDIIMEFMLTLNMEYEVSHGMALMYDYMLHRSRQANVEKNIEIVKELIELAKEMRDTWQEAIKLSKKPAEEIDELAIAK